MKVYFVRHGVSENSSQRMHQNSETPLSNLGIRQAEAVARKLPKSSIDLIYSSTYPRAKETAQIINQLLKVKYELMDTIREVKRSTAVEGLPLESELPLKIKKLSFENRHNPDWKYEDSESVREIWQRAGMVIDHLLIHHERQNILIVSHGGIIKAIITRALFGPELNPKIYFTIQDRMELRNTSISELDYNIERGWKLICWNNSDHLEPL